MEPTRSGESDAALWSLAKSGQLSAFGRILRRGDDSIRTEIRNRYGAGAPAQEIGAAALLELWRTRDILEPGERAVDLALARVPSVVDETGPTLLRSMLHATSSRATNADPLESALLYFGAGLPMPTVCAVLGTTASGVILALQRHQVQVASRVVTPTSLVAGA